MVQDEKGHYIHVVRFYTEDTYEGLLLGAPDERMNEEIVDSVRERATRYFGERRPFHLIPPVIRYGGRPPMLPHRICMAYLDSGEGLNGCMGSYLILAWFTNDEIETGIAAMVQAALDQIEWSAIAEGYDP